MQTGIQEYKIGAVDFTPENTKPALHGACAVYFRETHLEATILVAEMLIPAMVESAGDLNLKVVVKLVPDGMIAVGRDDDPRYVLLQKALVP